MEILTKQGRLKKAYSPAIYFDSSVVIDYWLAEPIQASDLKEYNLFNQETPLSAFTRELLRSERRLPKVAEIRKKLIFEDTKALAVVSPLAIIELIEWYAENKFKEIAAEEVGVFAIQRKSKKEIGDFLSKVLEERKLETDKAGDRKKETSTASELFVSETRLNLSFARCHGLQGLLLVDLKNFRIDLHSVPFILSYLQMGMADILRVLAAKHLGCEFIASFDSDFQRASKHIEGGAGLKVLTRPEDIIAALNGSYATFGP